MEPDGTAGAELLGPGRGATAVGDEEIDRLVPAGGVDLPVAPNLNLRIAGYHVDDNGYAQSTVSGYRSYSRDDSGVRATAVYTPTSKFSATAIVSYDHKNDGEPMFVPIGTTGPLGAQGYDTAVKGKNGFVCLVQRSWTTAFEDPEFWNPKMRSPVCLNPAAARSVLPHVLELTKWVLTGVPRTEMIDRTKAELAAKTTRLTRARQHHCTAR